MPLVYGHDHSWPRIERYGPFAKCSRFPHFTSKTSQKGRESAFLIRTCITLKLAYLQNYIADSNRILHNDKDHQLLFVGGLKQTYTKFTATISKNRKATISRQRFGSGVLVIKVRFLHVAYCSGLLERCR